MFHPTKIADKIAAIEKKLIADSLAAKDEVFSKNFNLVRHSPSAVEQANKHLESFLKEDGSLSKPLNLDEIRWIRNERAICRCDFEYWCSRYAYIQDLTGAFIRFKNNLAQKILHSVCAELEIEELAIILMIHKARQEGVTTWSELLALWRTMFTYGANTLLASSRPGKTPEMVKKMEICYERLPFWMIPKIGTRNAEKIGFDDQGSFFHLRHGSMMSDMGRGDTFTTFHLCFAPNTLVLSGKDGKLVPISKAVSGMEVLSGLGNRTQVKSVVKSSRIKEETAVIKPWGCPFPLETTLDHRILTPLGYCEAGDLKKGDKITFPVEKILSRQSYVEIPKYGVGRGRPALFPYIQSLSEKFGWFCGLYLAEGHLHKNSNCGTLSSVNIACDKDEVEDWKTELESLFPTHKIRSKQCPNSRTCHIFIMGSGLAEWINLNFGRVEHKHIPSHIWGWGTEFGHGLVRGYIEGDGHLVPGENTINIQSVRPEIVVPLRSLIASLGYGWASLTYRAGGVNCQHIWSIWLTGKTGKAVRERNKWESFDRDSRGQQEHWNWGIDSINLKLKEVSRGFCDDFWDLEVEAKEHNFCVLQGAVANSEVSEFLNPKEAIDGALLRAVHDSPWLLGILESTGSGRAGWWYDTWQYATQYWPRRESRICPVFLPWYLLRELYPTSTWMKKHPIPPDWIPSDRAETHAKKAEEYVQSGQNEVVTKELGYKWTMPKEQVWFWELERRYYESKKELHLFYQELCLSGETTISTARGFIPTKDVVVGDITDHGVVSKSWKTGTREIVELRTYKGRRLRLTPNHKISTPQGWEEAGALLNRDIILSPPIFGKEHNPELARLIGYFMGDGAWSRGSLRIACDLKDADVHDEVRELLTKYHNVPLEIVRGGMKDFQSNNLQKTDWLKQLGVLQSRGVVTGRSSQYKRLVCVPSLIRAGDKSTVRSFLSSLFECDGHAATKYVQISLSSKYRDFLEDVQLLLLGFGINSRISNDPKSMFRLTLNGQASELFHTEIGFISSRKANTAKHLSPGKGRPAEPNELLDKVVEIVPVGMVDVYDLTVPGDNCFGANGILVHNCATPEDGFQSPNAGVFDAEVIQALRDSTPMPYGVYGIRCSQAEIPSNLQIREAEIDRNQAPINIKCNWAPTQQSHNYTLYPLIHRGSAPFSPDGKIIIYEPPRPGKVYGLGVDTGYGIGKDRSVIEGLRKGDPQERAAQVFEFASNQLNSFVLWPICLALGTLYSTYQGDKLRQPKIVIEGAANGENVYNELKKRGWREFHNWVRYNRKRILESHANIQLWNTNSWSRPMMLDMLFDAVNSGWLDVNSPWFIEELGDLEVMEEKQKIAAAVGRYDDRIMALGIVLYSMHAMETKWQDLWRGRVDTEKPNPNPVYASYSVGAQGMVPDPNDPASSHTYFVDTSRNR